MCDVSRSKPWICEDFAKVKLQLLQLRQSLCFKTLGSSFAVLCALHFSNCLNCIDLFICLNSFSLKSVFHIVSTCFTYLSNYLPWFLCVVSTFHIDALACSARNFQKALKRNSSFL